MNFLRRTSPVHVRPEGVFGLRRSLNTPVVAIPDFPTGPGEGAILVHRELRGRLAVTLGVRSGRGGETALWDYEGRLQDGGAVDVAVDAALSFAEGMGFLFDDDELSGDSEQERLRARYLWEELMGTGEISGLDGSPGGEPDAELLLEEEAAEDETWSDDDLVLLTEVEAENTGPLVDMAEAAVPAVPLSKFRSASPPTGAPTRSAADLPPASAPDREGATQAAEGPSSPDPGLSAEAMAAWDDPGTGVAPRRPAGKRRTLDLADVTQPVASGASPGGSGQPRPPVRDVPSGKEAGAKRKDEAPKARGRAALGRLQLVKRRPKGDGEEYRGWLQRVLAAF